MTTLDHAWLHLASRRYFPRYKLQTFLFDHLDELTGSAGENPSTDKAAHPALLLWRTRAVRAPQEGNWTSLFRDERMSACEMRQVCASASFVAVMHLSALGSDSQQIRGAEARWLMPGLSDWQRQTHHRFSSPASLAINPACLIFKVEAPTECGNPEVVLSNRRRRTEWFATLVPRRPLIAPAC